MHHAKRDAVFQKHRRQRPAHRAFLAPDFNEGVLETPVVSAIQPAHRSHECGRIVPRRHPLSFSGLVNHPLPRQYVPKGAVFNEALLPDTDGKIGVLQMKVTVPIKNAGVRIPVSVTWASRDELNHEKIVHGQVGLSFDFDSLIAEHFNAR